MDDDVVSAAIEEAAEKAVNDALAEAEAAEAEEPDVSLAILTVALGDLQAQLGTANARVAESLGRLEAAIAGLGEKLTTFDSHMADMVLMAEALARGDVDEEETETEAEEVAEAVAEVAEAARPEPLVIETEAPVSRRGRRWLE